MSQEHANPIPPQDLPPVQAPPAEVPPAQDPSAQTPPADDSPTHAWPTESTATTRSTAARVGAVVGRAAGTAAKGTRSIIRKNPTANKVYRTTVGVVGGTTVALGVALIPLPGPGSLIAVGGLALLGTEFEPAKKVSTKANALAKKAYDKAKESRARKKAQREAPSA